MQAQDVSEVVQEFKDAMVRRFWSYKRLCFPADDPRFEKSEPKGSRPPVFHEPYAEANLLIDPALTDTQRQRLVGMIPITKRHRWFRSMSSSQALTQTVFGSLVVLDRLDLLAELETDDGERPFQLAVDGAASLALEVAVDSLGEPRPTQKDVAFLGLNPVTAECKLTEPAVGTCSRPTLSQGDPQYCNGSYSPQKNRRERCPLTGIGVRYWTLVARLFRIDPAIDHAVCPLNATYQLVRNVLATCIGPEGAVLPDARVVLICDERNPAFQTGGEGWQAYRQVREMLFDPAMLQRASWQRLARLLASEARTTWLADALEAKYGFLGRDNGNTAPKGAQHDSAGITRVASNGGGH